MRVCTAYAADALPPRLLPRVELHAPRLCCCPYGGRRLPPAAESAPTPAPAPAPAPVPGVPCDGRPSMRGPGPCDEFEPRLERRLPSWWRRLLPVAATTCAAASAALASDSAPDCPDCWRRHRAAPAPTAVSPIMLDGEARWRSVLSPWRRPWRRLLLVLRAVCCVRDVVAPVMECSLPMAPGRCLRITDRRRLRLVRPVPLPPPSLLLAVLPPPSLLLAVLPPPPAARREPRDDVDAPGGGARVVPSPPS